MICKPYTYAIGWKKLGVWYYGVRYSKDSYVGDIWITYFTSSPIVKSFVLNNGQPDIVKVTRTFETKEEACAHESRFLSRVGANTNNKMLNAHCAPAFPFRAHDQNSMFIPKVKEKMRLTKLKQGLVKFIRNRNFSPRKSTTLIDRIKTYIKLVSLYARNKKRIHLLLEQRLQQCLTYIPCEYPKNRKSTKRGKMPSISLAKTGKNWYYNPTTFETRPFKENEQPEGWVKGMIKNTPNNSADPNTKKRISISLSLYRKNESEAQKKNRLEKYHATICERREGKDDQADRSGKRR